jgi:hypothetical protein
MKRVTVSMPQELFEKLRLMARDRGISVSTLAREAIEVKAGFYNPNRPKPTIAGIGDSGLKDTARTVATERFLDLGTSRRH